MSTALTDPEDDHDPHFCFDSINDVDDYWSERAERESDMRDSSRDVPLRNEDGEIIDSGGWGI